MSDSDGKKTLGLRGASSRPGNVKQSFSHGRTKNVVVETKRKRVVVPKPAGAKAGGGSNPSLGDPSKRPAGITDSEMERRLKAVQAARAREAEEAEARAAERAAAIQQAHARVEDRMRHITTTTADVRARLDAEHRRHAAAMDAILARISTTVADHQIDSLEAELDAETLRSSNAVLYILTANDI